jgi:uncharacterized protein (TIGR02147 family)
MDYREFLRDFYQDRKNRFSYFSYRFIGSKVGLDPGYVVKLFQGKVHIADKTITRFSELCHFIDKERVYFEVLVPFTKAKSEKEIKFYYERLLQAKSLSVACVDKERFEFYQKWWYSAIRSLIGIEGFSGDYRTLAKRLTPAITPTEAKQGVTLLLKLGMIKQTPSNTYELTDSFITTGDRWQGLAVRDFQRETIRLAGESLDRHNKDLRDISTVTLSVDKKDLPEIRERVKEFRRSLLSFVNESMEQNEVYQLNVQLFPLTTPRESEG